MAETKTTTPGTVAKTPEENPKVVAPAGTVPTAMQAPGASTLPHPSEDKPDPTPGTKEEEEAKVRALDLPGENGPISASNIGDPIGEPVQCIVKRKFLSERGETVKPGMTFFYQERKGQIWPDYLEPVSKAKAAAVRKEAAERKADKEALRAKKAEARAFFDSVR